MYFPVTCTHSCYKRTIEQKCNVEKRNRQTNLMLSKYAFCVKRLIGIIFFFMFFILHSFSYVNKGCRTVSASCFSCVCPSQYSSHIFSLKVGRTFENLEKASNGPSYLENKYQARGNILYSTHKFPFGQQLMNVYH